MCVYVLCQISKLAFFVSFSCECVPACSLYFQGGFAALDLHGEQAQVYLQCNNPIQVVIIKFSVLRLKGPS